MQLKGQTFTYREFLEYSARLAKEGKTSGPDQEEPLIEYTALNNKRMERIDKHHELNDEFKAALDALDKPQYWIVLTETWCGDSPQNIPTIGKAAEYAGDKIQLTIALRDENTHLIDQFVPNQARAIPRLLIFDEEGNFITHWGARPQPAQEIIEKWKADPENFPKDDANKQLQLWYNKDKQQTLQQELIECLEKARLSKAKGEG